MTTPAATLCCPKSGTIAVATSMLINVADIITITATSIMTIIITSLFATVAITVTASLMPIIVVFGHGSDASRRWPIVFSHTMHAKS